MEVKAWVFRSNCTSNDAKVVNVDEAISILKTYDWKDEFQYIELAKDSDIPNHPASFNLRHSDGHSMEIIPEKDDLFTIKCWWMKNVKVLFLFPITKEISESFLNKNLEDAIRSIQVFFTSTDMSWIN